MLIHVVSSGKTMFSIAETYNLTTEYLQNINQLPNPNNLAVGQTLIIIYPEVTHTVAAGESLFLIATEYNTTVIQLLRNNPFLNDKQLEEGDELVITFQDKPTRGVEINGYTYPPADLNYIASMLPYLTYITIFTYGINQDGTLIEVNDDDEIIDLAISYGVAPIMNLSTLTSSGTFSSVLGSNILNDQAFQDILIANIILTLTKKNYYGLDVDFEYISSDDAEKYVNFIEKLTTTLNPLGFIVMTDLAPKVSATQIGTLYEGHDYLGMGRVANITFIMTYEWGYTYGPPMAVAPINNVRAVLNYAVTEIPREKILMGIPNYGYLWTLPFQSGITKATSLSIETALQIAADKNSEILYDSMSAAPYFYFTDDNGTPCIVWFEDARSTKAKLSLIDEYDIRGAGYWNLDRPYPQNWMILNAMYDIIQVIN